MVDLIIRKCGLSKEKPFVLQLRYHESYGEVEYYHIAQITERVAREIIAAGGAFWLFGDPDEAEDDSTRIPDKPQHSA
jgi:hypothetical protein